MKKINYKLVAALAITMLVGLTSNLVLAQDATDPAHPNAKTHEKDAATRKTTTVTQDKKTETKKDDKRTEDKPADRPVADKTEVHDTSHRDTHYTHDNQGWYDADHHRHDYITYRGERGYWEQTNGEAVFISIGAPVGIQIHL